MENLYLGDCNLLHSSDLVPLRRLNKLKAFAIQHSHHLKADEDDVEFLQTHAGDGLAANDLERALDLLERDWYARFERSLALTDRSVGYAWGGGVKQNK